VALSAAIGSLLLLPSAAFAGDPDCLWGSVCLYQHDNFDGGRARYVGNDSDYSNNTFDRCGVLCGLNDATSSVHNKGPIHNTWHYHHRNHVAPAMFLARQNWKANVGAFHNDEFSSHKWVQ
jgi:hypothetical protein